jgi:hypothetical protein
MKKLILPTLLCSVLVACSTGTVAVSDDPKEPNEKNFKAALSQYFEKNGELCLGIYSWPVAIMAFELESRDTSLGNKANQMEALAAVGLVKSKDDKNTRGYFLTDAAKPFLREQDLCWGKKSPNKIVKWDGPIKLGEYQEAKVTYTYQIDSLAEWAKKPEVQNAFKSMKTTLDNANKREDQHALKLTSEGWEALGLNK